MIRGDRIAARIDAIGTSQSAVARSLGVSQQAVGKLIHGETRNTSKLIQLARILETTPAYLEGEVDDPAEGYVAPPPPPIQFVTMQVALPSEAALARMFEGLLRPVDHQNLGAAELAQILARRLPTGLAQLRDLLPTPVTVEAREADADPPALATDRPASRQ
ncbi:helix-turn-helix domain-containing protein [Sphingomonas sp.]|jgi:transcriptional regulator with XRE-family HTH domain|uniref:helix-turn-helix domain-containing protein n=1 Tax=Sphingomonas sp. TaxID=28214 RepID=UPI002E109470|nr:helix-turn-helix domain-containing protein [Sphingomonas sp.]